MFKFTPEESPKVGSLDHVGHLFAGLRERAKTLSEEGFSVSEVSKDDSRSLAWQRIASATN